MRPLHVHRGSSIHLCIACCLDLTSHHQPFCALNRRAELPCLICAAAIIGNNNCFLTRLLLSNFVCSVVPCLIHMQWLNSIYHIPLGLVKVIFGVSTTVLTYLGPISLKQGFSNACTILLARLFDNIYK